MKYDLVINFILTGQLFNIPFGARTTRMELIQFLCNVEGFNKRNGVYEIIKKENAFFYFGFGTRGNLAGVKLNNLSSLEITKNIIDDLLAKNNILNQSNGQDHTYFLENGVKIYFKELRGQKFVNEIIKADSNVILNSLMSLN